MWWIVLSRDETRPRDETLVDETGLARLAESLEHFAALWSALMHSGTHWGTLQHSEALWCILELTKALWRTARHLSPRHLPPATLAPRRHLPPGTYLRNPLFDFKNFLHGLSLGIFLKDSQKFLKSNKGFRRYDHMISNYISLIYRYNTSDQSEGRAKRGARKARGVQSKGRVKRKKRTHMNQGVQTCRRHKIVICSKKHLT